MLFQDLAAAYMEKHLARKSSHQFYVRIFRQYFSGWREHPSRFEVRAWHIALSHVPAHANKGLGFLKAMYGWAQNTGDHTGQSALWTGDNPARGVRRHSCQSRERVLSDAELAQLFMFLQFAYPKLQAFVTILLCTGCRMSEARTMRWKDVDMVQGFWFKPTTKNGMSHRVPLPRQAVAALESLPRKGDYVFPGLYGRCWSRCGAEKAWGIFRRGPQLDGLTLHDIRRTVGSRVYEQTKDVMLVKAVLNHRPNSITEIYMRTQPKKIAAALQAHADALWLFNQEVPYAQMRADLPVRTKPNCVSIRSQSTAGARAGRMGTVIDSGSARPFAGSALPSIGPRAVRWSDLSINDSATSDAILSPEAELLYERDWR